MAQLWLAAKTLAAEAALRLVLLYAPGSSGQHQQSGPGWHTAALQDPLTLKEALHLRRPATWKPAEQVGCLPVAGRVQSGSRASGGEGQ